jgi:hypothetical protein
MSVEKRTEIDPPDEPLEPEPSPELKTILECLPPLSDRELYLLKQAVTAEQVDRETKKVMGGV